MELVSLQSTPPDRRPVSFYKAVSLVFHVLVVAALTYQVHGVAVRAVRRHTKAMKLVPYAPGHIAAAQPPKPKIVPPKEEPKLVMNKPEPPPPSSGGDPSGEADVTVALADFYPSPQPDLSLLPHGTRGDVLIDIVIDEAGKVVDAHVDQGLGHGVDETVLATVQTWTFTPATKAGKPVPSEQQLLFHFERA